MTLQALVINDHDNVANLIGPGTRGAAVRCRVEGQRKETTMELLEDIPSNHKIAFREIAAGEAIVKYGLNIGKATQAIRAGQHVHVHNIESNRGRGDLGA